MAGEPTLRYGDVDKGGWVAQLQSRLLAAGFNPGAVDGHFGDRTYLAVTAFQGANGLDADGIVGPLTWAALNGAPAGPPDDGEGGDTSTGMKIVNAGYDAPHDFVFYVAQNKSTETRPAGSVRDIVEVFSGEVSIFRQDNANADDLAPGGSYGLETATVTGGQAGTYHAWVTVDVDGFSDSVAFDFTVGDGDGGDGPEPPIVNTVGMTIVDAGYDASRDIVFYVAQNAGAGTAAAGTIEDVVEVTEDGSWIFDQNFTNGGDLGPGGSYGNETARVTGGQPGTYQGSVRVDTNGFSDTLVFTFTVGDGSDGGADDGGPGGGGGDFLDGGGTDFEGG